MMLRLKRVTVRNLSLIFKFRIGMCNKHRIEIKSNIVTKALLDQLPET